MLPSAAIAAFAESLVEGRRVLLLGSSGHNLWQKLLDRGARLVHVCDPDPVRLSEAAARNTSHNASFAPLSNQAALALRDSVFDVGIIDNLAAFSDPSEAMRLLRRALSPRGLAFVTAPNPDVRESLLPDVTPSRNSLDYYSLYDLVHSEFPIVRMLGQMPFVGYTMAELAPLDEPEPTIDAGFVPGGTEEPEWFVAAASAQPFEINSFTVVQVPVDEVLHHSSERQLREQLRVSRTAERSAVERLARLEAQQLDLAARAAEAKENAEASRQVSQLRLELTQREDRIVALEARAVSAETRLGEAGRQFKTREERQAELEAQVAAAEARLGEAQRQFKSREERQTELEAQAVAAEARLGEAGRQFKTREERQAELEAQVAAAEARLGEAQRQLKSREERQSAFEAQAIAAEARLIEAERQLNQTRPVLARAERAEAEHSQLTKQLEEAREHAKSAEQLAAEATGDIARLEEQLRERGHRLRELESDLKIAERLGQQLIRDLEAARQGRDRRFGTEAWAATHAVLAPEPLPPNTAQSSGMSSAWVAPQVESPVEVQSPVTDVQRMADERARLEADLIAARWRIEQLLSVIEKNHTHQEKLTSVKAQLSDAQRRLNEQAALLSQLEPRT